MKKTVLITGSSRGIGAETACLFAERGYFVIIHYHKNKEKALLVQERIEKMGGHALCLGADISRQKEAALLVEQAFSRTGKIDVLVNNAGIAKQQMLCDVTEQDWDDIFGVNIKGMFFVTQAVLPFMVHEKHGSIVNLSSIWGLCGASCEVVYSASKAAVIGFTQALAKELGPSGIRVNCVAPGVIQTDMNASLSPETLLALQEETPLDRLGTAHEVAEAVYFLASEASRFTTGQVLSPNGGLVI